MKKYILLLLLAVPLYPQAVNPEPDILKQWVTYPKGLHTQLSSQFIADDEFQDCSNVVFDGDYAIDDRDGFARVSQTYISSDPVRFAYKFKKSNGSEYGLLVCSTTLAYSSDLISWTLAVSTLPSNTKVWAVTYEDKCYIGTYDGDRWTFDGSALIVSTYVPQCKHMIVYTDKLVAFNINETNGRSKVVYCETGNPFNWRALDFIYLDRDDGDELVGGRVYEGKLYAFKKYGAFQLINLEDDFNTNDGQYKILASIGCLYIETMQEKDGLLLFQSQRGLEQFSSAGVKPEPLSERIMPNIQALNQMKLASSSWIENSSVTFGGGTYYFNVTTDTPLGVVAANTASSVTVAVNTSVFNMIGDRVMDFVLHNDIPNMVWLANGSRDIMFSSFTYAIGWSSRVVDSSGTYCALDIGSDGVIQILYTKHIVNPIDVMYASWTGVNFSTRVVMTVPAGSSFADIAVDSSNKPHMAFSDNTAILYSSFTVNVVSTNTAYKYNSAIRSIAIATHSNMPYILWNDQNAVLVSSLNANGTFLVNPSTVCARNAGSTLLGGDIEVDSSGNMHVIYIDEVPINVMYASHTFNVGWSSAAVFHGIATIAFPSIAVDSNKLPHISLYNSQVIHYPGSAYDLVYASRTANGFTNTYLDGNGVDVGIFSKIQIDSKNRPNIAYIDTDNGRLKYYNLNYGMYISKVFNASLDNSWQNWVVFLATSAGNVQFYAKTATNLASINTVPWVRVYSGINLATNNGPFIQYKLVFLDRTSTDLVSSMQFNYYIDFQNKPLTAFSRQVDRRYWLAGAIYPYANNDIVYMLDQNNVWTKFSGINAASFIEFNNEVYFGDSSNGVICKISADYTTDNGASIDPWIKTKDYDCGSYTFDKYMDSLWVSVTPTNTYENLHVSYYVNKSTEPLYMSTTTSLAPYAGYNYMPVIKKITTDNSRWRYISFKFNNFDKFLGYVFKYYKHGEGQ